MQNYEQKVNFKHKNNTSNAMSIPFTSATSSVSSSGTQWGGGHSDLTRTSYITVDPVSDVVD